MNKTLSNFMIIALVMLVMVTLYFGLAYKTLEKKFLRDAEIVEEYQIDVKG